VTPAPSGPLHCAAEYEPTEGILMAWEGLSTWNDIQKQMALHITTTGNALVYMVVDTVAEQSAVQAALAAINVDLGRVRFLVTTTDTIWIRDYGPRYVFQGDCRVIVDHTYNRPRPSDDRLPAAFGQHKRHAFYEHQLVHGGGNFHLDGQGRSFVTRLINNENRNLSESQIHDIWRRYQNVDTTFHEPFPTAIDATQHIDMWMQVVGDRQVVVSDWPFDRNSTQDQICNAAATDLANRGYAVRRVIARSVGNVHYTYTNVVLCNDLVLIPSYTHATVVPHNAQALAAWQAAMPGKTIVAIDSQAIVTYAGVLHCIAMHVPRSRGGLEPRVYLVAPNGGEVLQPNTPFDVRWVSDDDETVSDVDILLSLNGGASFDEVIARNVPDTGSFRWNVPDWLAPMARVRVVARDGQGRTGGDASDQDLRIAGAICSAANVSYGKGTAGSRGVPELLATTSPRLPSVWPLQLRKAAPNDVAFLVFGARSGSWAFPGGELLVEFAGLLPWPTDANGAATLQLLLPDEPLLCGHHVFWQAFVPVDGSASAGLDLRFGR
jgi:agmatine/peptidylarginine deiminase